MSQKTSAYDQVFSELLEKGLAYRYLAPVWENLLELGSKDFESPWQLEEVNGQLVVDELIQPALSSIVLSPKEVAYLKWLAECWPKFMAAQNEIFTADLRVARLVGSAKELWARQQGIEPGYNVFSPFIRLDCVRNEEGKLMIVDINSTRPAGVGDNLVLAEVMYPEFNSPMKPVFTEMMRECWDQYATKHRHLGDACLGVVTEKLAGDWHNFRIITETLAGQPWVDEVFLQENLDSLPENCNFILRSRIKEGHGQFAQLEQEYGNGRGVISPLYRRWIGNKIWMQLITSKKYARVFQKHLGEAYLDFSQTFVHTGIYSNGQIAFGDGQEISLVGLDRKEWVVKESAGSSGKQMHFGCSNSQIRWNQVMSSLPNHSIFQRYYRQSAKEKIMVLGKYGLPVKKEFYIKYGVFLFNGRLAGVEVMARPEPKVHGSRDTYLTLATW